jgi:hypothetical protein
MDDKQLAKLIRKNAEKAAQPPKPGRGRAYDPTAPVRDEDAADAERTQLFKDMKRREF